MSTDKFVEDLVKSANVPLVPLLYVLSYLVRLRLRPQSRNAVRLSNTHGLILALLMIARKVIYDDEVKNAWWHKRVPRGPNMINFTIKDVNQMERYILKWLNWDLRVRDDELRWLSEIEGELYR